MLPTGTKLFSAVVLTTAYKPKFFCLHGVPKIYANTLVAVTKDVLLHLILDLLHGRVECFHGAG